MMPERAFFTVLFAMMFIRLSTEQILSAKQSKHIHSKGCCLEFKYISPYFLPTIHSAHKTRIAEDCL